MADYCEKETIYKTLENKLYNEASRSTGERREFCFEIMDNLKSWCNKIITADVRENVPGEWILDDDDDYYELWKCSACGNGIFDHRYDFCPNCGADMRLRDKE